VTADRPRLCVLGSINMDLVVRAPRLPAPGETLLGGPFETHPGGKGANQAVAAARLGAQVSFIGAVGDDEHGRAMRAVVQDEAIDVSHVTIRRGTPTGVALITVCDPGGDNTIVVAPGANVTLTPADVDIARPVIAAADMFLVQLETPIEAVARAAELARDAGTTVILNAAPAAALPAALWSCIDVLIVNETEAAAITSHLRATPLPNAADELEAALLRAASLGPTTTILTAGPRGALFAHATTDRGRVPACIVEPIDTVGAGDAFCGAFATRLAEHQINAHRTGLDRMAVMDAVCWACAAGALATTKPGAIPSLPTRADVIALLRRA
jgi:ribokinase